MAKSARRRASVRTYVAEILESRRLLAADLVISEFLSSNDQSIKDSFGNHEDWLEIHNRGDAAANLNDYFLTDSAGNPEEWRFPVQSLAAGAYLVVFASGRDLAVAGQELHTNFKLGADGEYLALIRAADDSVQFAYAPTFPPQTKDISYGLSDSNDPNSALMYFSIPTPGAANTPSVATPTFSVPGQVFTGTLNVALSDTTPGAVIHYTLDGSTPSASSLTYSTPFSLTTSKPIRAIATASGFTSSPIISQTYERVDSTVTSVQNQNLPIVVIDTYGQTMGDVTGVAGSATVVDTADGSANVLGPADYQGRIGIHIRGSTSETYDKKQYAIELWDENNNDKKVSLLGMPAQSDWVLYAPYTENTLMQNHLPYEWSTEMGHYAPRTRYVEVYMSTGGSAFAGNTSTINYTSNYLGVFILMEKVKIDDSRVDVDPVSATNPGGGFIVEQDRYVGTNFFTTTSQGVHIVLDDPDNTSVKSLISTQWNNFENALFTGTTAANQPWDTPGNANYYGNYIDVGSFVDYYLIQEMTRNIDAFWLSTFYTKAADTTVNGVTQRGLISAGPVWDFNLSLGAVNYNASANSAGYDTNLLSPAPGAAGVATFNPQDAYFQRLLADPNFVQAVSDRWYSLRQGVFSDQKLVADIDADVSTLSDNTGVYPVGNNPTGTTSPVMRNFQKWNNLASYETTRGMYDPTGSWIQDVNLMKNWLKARVDWLDTQYITAPVLSPVGGSFGGPTTVTATPYGKDVASDTVLLDENAPAFATIPTSSNDPAGWQLLSASTAGWTSGSTGVGYDNNTSPVNFNPLIHLNVGAMFNVSSSVYIRVPFTLTQAQINNIQHLVLKMKYDDGFIAWINGVRVMDANSPENINPVRTTAAASGGRQDSAALTAEEFDVSSIKSSLVAGTNVLAIQGLNTPINSSDLLMLPQLVSRTYTPPVSGTVYYTTDGSDPRLPGGGISPTAQTYSAGIALSASARIRARTLVGTQWSALNDQVYDFSANTLRVTELMYNPPAPPTGSAFTAQDFEFVEVKNVGTAPVNLNGFSFTDGITFAFPNVALPAGAYGVIVKNLAAYQSRYGTGANILGAYGGQLDNDGETLTFQNAFNQPMQSFKYNDSWYKTTDGKGPSLVIRDAANADPASWATAAAWRPSDVAMGAPGFADADAASPAVQSWTATDTSGGQPAVTFNFAGVISAGSPATFNVTDVLTSQPVTVAGHTFNSNAVTFSMLASLASGVYRFTLPAGSIVNVSNLPTAADNTFTVALVRAGQTLVLPSTSPTLRVQKLLIGAGGTLDIGTGALVIDYTGPSPLDDIRALVASGFNAGGWNGTGISSSAAANDLNALTTVGLADNTTLGRTSFAGVDGLTGHEILLKRTYYGDTDLTGDITLDDFTQFLSGYQNGGSTWLSGDFDYNGKVTLDDFTLFLDAYQRQGPTL